MRGGIPVGERRYVEQLLQGRRNGSVIEELVIVSLVILIFLWHVPSAIIPAITIPMTAGTRIPYCSNVKPYLLYFDPGPASPGATAAGGAMWS